ncbi:hypothetical protein PRIPAC_82294 [Pristionchus pacificus]|uniref:G protein-coupled receptor n=1 Tax=Pristionchus pacificus TaxID=54126 RepID=A0A454Y3M1_PRIPA|nr:hypothetical protein PRIPAC_82294 [Pristionchus pacificus]|eukprot:PDM78944.1 G protein-coupled receptor [Pristionchus pacificus]
MDLTTLEHLKFWRKEELEVNLFFQSFSQTLPFVGCFITFAYITPHLESRFLSTTGVWHAVYFIDGLNNRHIPHEDRVLYAKVEEEQFD